MNIFIEQNMPFLVILAIPTCTVFVIALGGLAYYLIDRAKLSDRISIAALLTAIACSFIIFFYGTAKLYEHYNNGKLEYMFILKSKEQTRLLAWTEMDDWGGGMSTVYANRFKLYDLSSGKLLQQTFLNRHADWNDYVIYGPFPDGRAWSYSSDTGLSLLDLFEAKVIMDEKQIRKRLPKLGKSIRISSGRKYDSKTDAIFVTTPDGKIHNIRPKDLGSIQRKVSWLNTASYKKSIDLPEDLSEGHVYTSFPWDKERLVFITIRGYTLSALRIDPATGTILGRIDYFD